MRFGPFRLLLLGILAVFVGGPIVILQKLGFNPFGVNDHGVWDEETGTILTVDGGGIRIPPRIRRQRS